MTPDKWREIKRVFTEAMERSQAEREGYINAVAEGDEELSSAVRRFLQENEATGGFLDNPVSVFANVLLEAPGTHSLSPGELLCERFEILRFIARGGMGEVYEAWDSELREHVALKTIRREIAIHEAVVEQFKAEVRRARGIRSDHVCRVYDLFTHTCSDGRRTRFLTMQLIQGESLTERLKRERRITPRDAGEIITGILSGLQAAHKEGIVHGDLKTGNVLLLNRGDGHFSAVLTDFGLAAPTSSRGHHAAEQPCGRGGTPAYMAPEQWSGAAPLEASDIYAVGVIGYEILAGCRPTSAGEDSAGEFDAGPALRTLVPEISQEWVRAIGRCLHPDPGRRFPSAEEAADAFSGRTARRRRRIALRLVAVMAAVAIVFATLLYVHFQSRSFRPPPRSLAVLPFTDPAGGSHQYLADGFTEELTHALTRIPGLQVVGRDSAFRFRRSALSERDIGRRLGARYVLAGTVRTVNGHVRVIARLIRTIEGFQIWSRDFDGEERDVLELQNRMAQQVSGALQEKLAAIQAIDEQAALPDVGARDLYWLGRSYWRQRTDDSVRRSLDYFEKAVQRDPNYALAWTGIAESYCVLAEAETVPPAEALSRARDAALKAVELDRTLADAYASLGQIASLYDRDFDQAEKYFRRALALDGSLVTAHQWYSYMLVKQRRFGEAIAEANKAVEIDPLSVPANINLAVQYFYSGNYDAATVECKKLDQMEPKLIFTHLMTAHMLARRGRYAEAISAMENVRARADTNALTVRTIGEVNALAGRRVEAEHAIAELMAERQAGRVPASYIAIVYSALNQRDNAFEWLEKAYNEYDGFLSILNVYPEFEGLRSDPRFSAMLRRLGLKEKTVQDSGLPRDTALRANRG